MKPCVDLELNHNSKILVVQLLDSEILVLKEGNENDPTKFLW